MARPAEAHEAAIGVIEIIEAVEEMQAGIDEGRTSAANQRQIGRRKRIAVVAEREGVERLGRMFVRNR
jgi:hypothetical protein